MFKDAYLKHKKVEGVWIPYMDGDTSPSDRVIVEKFVPMNHEKASYQKNEYRWVDKAHKLLYSNNLDKDFRVSPGKNLKTVWKSSSTESKAA